MAQRKKAYRGAQADVKTAVGWLRSMRDSAKRAQWALKDNRCASAYNYVLNVAEDYQRYSALREGLMLRAAGGRGKARGWRGPANKARRVIEAFRRKCVVR